MSNIGFLANQDEKEIINTQKENAIYTFDSGYTISQEDAKLHTLILGTTGTGKTTSVFLPMLHGLMCAGECGLIIDIKGNLREQVRTLAKACDREKDIFEFGLSDTAIACNIIENMNTKEIFSFLELILDKSMDDKTNNKDFHIRGVMQCVQVYEFLKIYAKRINNLAPSLKDILDMISNPTKASKLFLAFKERLYDKSNEEERALIEEIEADAFHVLQYEIIKEKTRSNAIEQMNYAINGPRTALAEVFSVKNMEEKFSCKKAPGINIKNNFYKNRIVILRFTPGSGAIGNLFSRYFMTKYYETVFEIQPKEIYNYPSFICIDEFHEVASLNNKARFSDTAFVAQAREFRASFVASTQSAASLMCNGNDEEAVKAFVSNCNTRIYFRTDDPVTQKLVKPYDENVSLVDIEHANVYLTSYSDTDKKLVAKKDSVNNSFAKVQELLKNPFYQISKEEIQNTNEILFNTLRRERRREIIAEEQAMLERKKNITIPMPIKIYDKNDPEECKIQMQAFLQDFIIYFDELNAQKTYVPLSWQEAIYKGFEAFAKLKLDISIQAIGYDIDENCIKIEVFEEIESEDNKKVEKVKNKLNALLRKSFQKHRQL